MDEEEPREKTSRDIWNEIVFAIQNDKPKPQLTVEEQVEDIKKYFKHFNQCMRCKKVYGYDLDIEPSIKNLCNKCGDFEIKKRKEETI